MIKWMNDPSKSEWMFYIYSLAKESYDFKKSNQTHSEFVHKSSNSVFNNTFLNIIAYAAYAILALSNLI